MGVMTDTTQTAADTWTVAGRTFSSRLIVGTGKYASYQQNAEAYEEKLAALDQEYQTSEVKTACTTSMTLNSISMNQSIFLVQNAFIINLKCSLNSTDRRWMQEEFSPI